MHVKNVAQKRKYLVSISYYFNCGLHLFFKESVYIWLYQYRYSETLTLKLKNVWKISNFEVHLQIKDYRQMILEKKLPHYAHKNKGDRKKRKRTDIKIYKVELNVQKSVVQTSDLNVNNRICNWSHGYMRLFPFWSSWVWTTKTWTERTGQML